MTADELTVEWRRDSAGWLDVAAFAASLQQASSTLSDDGQIAALERAVAAYGGELLPGCYSDWLLAERDRLAQAYAAALEQLVALYEARRDYRAAIGHALALLRHDPLHEPAHAQLMRLHALNDDRAAALHTYHTCATTLRRELDIEPGPTMRRLYQQLLTLRRQPVTPAPAEAAIPLAGRETEWQQLQHAWRLAAQRPRVVLITGETGIGKTRLAEALTEWVGRQGIPALTARGFAAGGELPYAPVVTWLRCQPPPSLADPWLRELARLMPEIRADRPNLPPPEPLTENWQRLHLFAALRQALLSGRTALLLVLDDLQWCDRESLDWLHYLVTMPPEEGARMHILVVATLRSEEDDENPPLSTWRSELIRAGLLTEIGLGPLSEENTLALADRVARQPFDRALAPLLYQGTEGHPLFIVEMVRAGFAQTPAEPARHAAAMSATPASLPDKVRQVLEARLAQLTPAARRVIELAAVVGRAFSFGVLAQAADLDEETLVACLDEGWRRRIIREHGADTYDFSHDKLREAAYGGLSPARRRWLHGRVAQALVQSHAGDLDRVAGVVAGHYAAAGQPAPAVTYLGRAAAQARRIYAHADALAALERAIDLFPQLPDEVTRHQLAAHLYEELGDLHEVLAQHDLARDAYRAALASLPAANTITQACLLRKIGKTLENERTDFAAAAAAFEAAETVLGIPGEASDPAWWEAWCQVQVDYLILLYWWNRWDDMAQRIARVQPAIAQHGTPLQRAALFGNLSRYHNRRARFAPSDIALSYARDALAALPPAASPQACSPHQFGLGFNLLWHGDYAEAAAALCAALALAEQTGDVTLQARCLAYLTVAQRRQGDAAGVEAYARRGQAAAEAARAQDYIGASRANLAWLAELRGATSEATQLAQSALAA